jgi:hypothetical protein
MEETVSPPAEMAVETTVVAASETGVSDSGRRGEMEQQILAATVRLELESWFVEAPETGYLGNGHATHKDGRYLITHNHYHIPMSIFPERQEGEVKTLVDLYKANGEHILEAPLTDFTVIFEDAETLVFYVGETIGDRLAEAGVNSAEFKNWTSLDLRPGMEVAQIDWDGSSAHVDWAPIEAVITNDGTPRLKISNYIKVGASGGAVFSNGFHIGNNWTRVDAHDETGMYSHLYSVAALNSDTVVSMEGRGSSVEDGAETAGFSA